MDFLDFAFTPVGIVSTFGAAILTGVVAALLAVGLMAPLGGRHS